VDDAVGYSGPGVPEQRARVRRITPSYVASMQPVNGARVSGEPDLDSYLLGDALTGERTHSKARRI
jgi:hypothetical protein